MASCGSFSQPRVLMIVIVGEDVSRSQNYRADEGRSFTAGRVFAHQGGGFVASLHLSHASTGQHYVHGIKLFPRTV